MKRKYPRVYLAIDNCVFYKRWTRPAEWASMISALGLQYIEASADNELDPLFMDREYLRDWISDVKKAEQTYGVKVCNLYSGHGTYTTLGLTHTDSRVREHIVKNWFIPMMEIAGELGCGMGFFAHAFNHSVLQAKDLYEEYVEILTRNLVRINQYAGETGCGLLAIEQMYTPHQYPWRRNDTKNLIAQVTRRSKRDFYFTEDVGHHHTKFMRPRSLPERELSGAWFGTDYAFQLVNKNQDIVWEDLEAAFDLNPYLFSELSDGDCYETLRKLGCYSPIVHLQQTNGVQSSHQPFTPEKNQKGKINGHDVLNAIKESYDTPVEAGMPEQVHKLYLTLELFSETTSIMYDLLNDIHESVKYWRQFIPTDGMMLDELVNLLEE